MSWSLLLASLVIPVAVLLIDYGRRPLTTMRILRPFVITAVVAPFVAPGFDLGARGLLLEGAGIAAGALLGLLASAAMRVERDAAAGVVTVAGVPYVAVWLAVSLARLMFSYEAGHSASFDRAIGSFLVTYHFSATALADAIMFLGFAMLIAQRGVLAVRSRRLARTPVGKGTPAAMAQPGAR